MIGFDTGPYGDIFFPVGQGVRAWVADVNARGGLKGHPVRLIAADDAGDPGRALALARRMVDQDHVVAFIGEHSPTTFQSVMPFLEERKIPVLGTCNCTVATAQSPMGFDTAPGGDRGIAWAQLGPGLALSDKRKVSIPYCREAPTCGLIRQRIHDWAEAGDFEIVHEAQVSITQPDYTAEVLAARNAGADIFSNALDNASIIRLARSAHRQNYHPVLLANWASLETRNLERGGKDVEGELIGSATPHWDSPKLADYRTALRRYVPEADFAIFSVISYLGGKLLEVASANFPDQQVTSADVLNGLYALKGETIGGIFPPITFIPDQPNDGVNLCVYPYKVEKGKFVAPKGDEYVCAPGWQPR